MPRTRDGERVFYGRKFLLGPATLDPRPGTETLIEAALEIANEEGWRSRPLRILDAGTGSGCILLTLLAELPRAEGVGSDISVEALGVAAENARRLGLAARAQLVEGRYLENVGAGFDLIVSNPPYIPTQEIAALEPEVREHDPLAALDGGPDGLDAFREIARGLRHVAGRNSWALLEIGAGQASAVNRILQSGVDKDEREIRTWVDLDGHIRCVALKPQI